MFANCSRMASLFLESLRMKVAITILIFAVAERAGSKSAGTAETKSCAFSATPQLAPALHRCGHKSLGSKSSWRWLPGIHIHRPRSLAQKT